MKQIIFNETNLTENEIDKRVIKVRAFILNSQRQAIIAKNAGIYLLPGGTVEKTEKGQDEKDEEAMIREIQEETGITLATEEIKQIREKGPFLEIQSYERNHKSRRTKEIINRLIITRFYEVYTNQNIDITKQHLTESEKEQGFYIEFMNLSKIAYKVENNQTDNPKRKQFDREIMTALKEFTKLKGEKTQIKIR